VLLLAAQVLAAPCECKDGLPSLAVERTALPAVYEAVFGLVPAHTREYHQRRLDQGETDSTALARAWSGLDRDDKAAELVRAQPAALGRYLARQGRWREAAEAFAKVESPPLPVWYQHTATRFMAQARPRSGPTRRGCLLGCDLADRLGADFRATAPGIGVVGAVRGQFETALWPRLGLPADPFEGVLATFGLARDDWSEPYFALGELLAACGYRRLAWFAYQHAWELQHPLSDELPGYQAQAAQGLPATEAHELTAPRYYRLRRTALAWVGAFQAWERRTLADGGDPEDPQALARFYQEHPKP
jgi:hypothetical protein